MSKFRGVRLAKPGCDQQEWNGQFMDCGVTGMACNPEFCRRGVVELGLEHWEELTEEHRRLVQRFVSASVAGERRVPGDRAGSPGV